MMSKKDTRAHGSSASHHAKKTSVSDASGKGKKKEMLPIIIILAGCAAILCLGLWFLFSKGDTSSSSSTQLAETDGETSGYAGADENGNQVYWLIDSSMTSGVYAEKDTDGTMIVYEGAVTQNDDGTITQNNDADGSQIIFTISSWEDSNGNACYIMNRNGYSNIAILYPYDSTEIRSQIALLENE